MYITRRRSSLLFTMQAPSLSHVCLCGHSSSTVVSYGSLNLSLSLSHTHTYLCGDSSSLFSMHAPPLSHVCVETRHSTVVSYGFPSLSLSHVCVDMGHSIVVSYGFLSHTHTFVWRLVTQHFLSLSFFFFSVNNSFHYERKNTTMTYYKLQNPFIYLGI